MLAGVRLPVFKPTLAAICFAIRSTIGVRWGGRGQRACDKQCCRYQFSHGLPDVPAAKRKRRFLKYWLADLWSSKA
jgi:hypothetical protein